MTESATWPRTWRQARERLGSDAGRTGAVLLASPVLLMLFTYFGSDAFYRGALSTPATYRDLDGFAYHHLGAFVLLGLGSVAVASAVRMRPAEFGLCAGDARFGATFCALAIPLLVLPITYGGSFDPEVARTYPLARGALEGGGPFARHAALYVLYYVGWELHFRGLLLFRLAPRVGAWNAVFIQVIPSTLIHTCLVTPGKPFTETLAAAPTGIVLGWLALRTRSVWPAIVIHAAVGVSTDLWQYLRVPRIG